MQSKAQQISDLVNSKEYKLHMECLSKNKSLKSMVTRLNALTSDLSSELKQIDAAKEKRFSDDNMKLLSALVVQVLKTIGKIVDIQSRDDYITASIKECPDELIQLTKLQQNRKNKALKALLKSSQQFVKTK